MVNVEKFRALLMLKAEELRVDLETGYQAEETVELDQTRIGRLTRMDALQSQAMSKAAGERRKEQLVEIARAIRRIDEGDYGRCLECDEEISEGRLEFDPAARFCIRCAK